MIESVIISLPSPSGGGTFVIPMRRMFTRPAAKPAATLFGTVRCDGEFSAKKPIAATIRLMPKTAKRVISTADCTFVGAGFPDGGLRNVRVSGLSRLYAGTAKSLRKETPERKRVLRDHFCIRGASVICRCGRQFEAGLAHAQS